MQHNLLINGKLVAGEGEKVPVYNPATGEVIPRLPEATAAQSMPPLRRRTGHSMPGVRRRRRRVRNVS